MTSDIGEDLTSVKGSPLVDQELVLNTTTHKSGRLAKVKRVAYGIAKLSLSLFPALVAAQFSHIALGVVFGGAVGVVLTVLIGRVKPFEKLTEVQKKKTIKSAGVIGAAIGLVGAFVIGGLAITAASVVATLVPSYLGARGRKSFETKSLTALKDPHTFKPIKSSDVPLVSSAALSILDDTPAIKTIESFDMASLVNNHTVTRGLESVEKKHVIGSTGIRGLVKKGISRRLSAMEKMPLESRLHLAQANRSDTLHVLSALGRSPTVPVFKGTHNAIHINLSDIPETSSSAAAEALQEQLIPSSRLSDAAKPEGNLRKTIVLSYIEGKIKALEALRETQNSAIKHAKEQKLNHSAGGAKRPFKNPRRNMAKLEEQLNELEIAIRGSNADHARVALKELAENNCSLSVWGDTDRGQAKSWLEYL